MIICNRASWTMFLRIAAGYSRCMVPAGVVLLVDDSEVAADPAWRQEIDILARHCFAEVIEGVGAAEVGTLH